MAERFVIKRSQLTTLKLFVEFYLPQHENLLEKMKHGPYPVKSLGHLSKRIFDGPFGSNRKVEMYQESGIPYMRVKDVLPEGIMEDGLTYISPEKHQELQRSRVLPGNVLITIAGRLGTAAVFPEHLQEGNITGHIVGLELPETINPHYVTTALNSHLGQFQVERWGHRTTRPELNIQEIKQIEIPLPPRPIQDRIAATMQEAYTRRREMLAEAEGLIKTMDKWALEFLKLFVSNFVADPMFLVSSNKIMHRWDVGYYQPLNPTLLGEEWCYLEEYATEVRETIVPSKEADNSYYYVGIDTMNNNPYSTQESATNLLGNEINGLRKCFKGRDVLLARLAPTLSNKKSALVPNNLEVGYCSPEFLVIRPKKEFDPRFVLWSVKADFAVTQMLLKTTGATPSQMRLHAPELLKIRVPKASIDQQYKIGQELERRHYKAAQLRREAETVVAAAKARVERMILGEETP